jgi:hypothetical protein
MIEVHATAKQHVEADAADAVAGHPFQPLVGHGRVDHGDAAQPVSMFGERVEGASIVRAEHARLHDDAALQPQRIQQRAIGRERRLGRGVAPVLLQFEQRERTDDMGVAVGGAGRYGEAGWSRPWVGPLAEWRVILVRLAHVASPGSTRQSA